MTDIGERMRRITAQRNGRHIRLMWDDEALCWVGEAFGQPKPDFLYAEGATPSEVLRKLAEMME